MGSTARRGGDGVRYCGGRSPRGIIKDAALIIIGIFRRASGARGTVLVGEGRRCDEMRLCGEVGAKRGS